MTAMAARVRFVNLLVYFLLLALSVSAAYLLNSRFGYTPLLFLILVLPLDAVCMLRSRHCVRRLSGPDFQKAARGQPAAFHCTFENKSRILVCHLYVSLRLTGPKGSRTARNGASIDIAPQQSETLSFALTPEHVGVYRVRMQSLRIYGPVGLFSMKLPVSRPAVLIATPSGGKDASGGQETGSGYNESAAPTARGGDSNDGYNGVREYAPGDLLRSIHWKLTAHNQKLMTRLYEEEEEGYVTVAADLRPASGTAERQLCTHDQLCESAYRLSCGRAERGGKVRLVFFDGEKLQTVLIKSEADLAQAAVELASAGPARDALTGAPGGLPRSGELLAVSAHLDEALARELGELSDAGGRALFLFVAPEQSSAQDSSVFFRYLAEHDVECAVAEAQKTPKAQKAKRERLEIGRSAACEGGKNERIFRSQQSR